MKAKHEQKKLAIKFSKWMLENSVEPTWDINDGDVKLWKYKGWDYAPEDLFEEFVRDKCITF